jgi:hypothetical protein
MALALVSVSGCASVDSRNTDPRAWGRASEHEQREQWWGIPGVYGLLYPCPTWEQQRNEEWLRSH